MSKMRRVDWGTFVRIRDETYAARKKLKAALREARDATKGDTRQRWLLALIRAIRDADGTLSDTYTVCSQKVGPHKEIRDRAINARRKKKG